jgi:hypothetical protein
VPFLQPIIILPDEVCANLVVENSFNGGGSILDGQTDHDPAHAITVVMDDAGWCDGILHKLVTQQILDLQLLYIIIEFPRNLLHTQYR